MQGLLTLRPEIVQQLLESCNSIKVKRLFMHLAEIFNHPWLKHINLEKVNFGEGKRAIAGGGIYNPKYKLSLPRIKEIEGDYVMTKNQLDSDVDMLEESDKIHPWRICPIGKHYVRTHNLHIPPSKDHQDGQTVIRHAHCADNPSHKDMLSYDEIQIISNTHFSALEGPPKTGVLKDFHDADNFDELIRGWVHYWNEIFHAKDTLDPNLIKALIASESSFDPQKSRATKSKKLGSARGLMQITDATLTIIGDHDGELRDHIICLTHTEVMDPSANICTGVRWLFMKKAAASERLHHQATWDDAVAEYKGILKDIIKYKDDPKHNPDPYNEMSIFRSLYDQLQGS